MSYLLSINKNYSNQPTFERFAKENHGLAYHLEHQVLDIVDGMPSPAENTEEGKYFAVSFLEL